MQHTAVFFAIFLFILTVNTVSGCISTTPNQCGPTNFYGGSLIWKATGRVVTFTFTGHYALSWENLDTNSKQIVVDFDDNTRGTYSLTLVQKFTDYLTVAATFSHTYPVSLTTSPVYLPNVRICCRRDGLKGSPYADVKISAKVYPGKDGEERQSPSVQVPGIVPFGQGNNVLVLQSSLRSTRISFNPDSGHGYSSDNGDVFKGFNGPPSLVTVPEDSAAYKLLWTTSTTDKGFWSLQVKLVNDFGYSTTEFLIQVGDAAVQSNPVSLTFDRDSRFQLKPGDPVSIGITCTTPNSPGAALKITLGGLVGTFSLDSKTDSSASVTSGRKIQLSWTPTYDDNKDTYRQYVIPVTCLNPALYISDVKYIQVYVSKRLTLTPPDDTTVKCIKCTRCGIESGTPTATDGCCGDIGFSRFDLVPPGFSQCNSYITRRWTAFNQCNERVDQNQTIRVNDDVPPYWLEPLPDSPTSAQCYSEIDSWFAQDAPFAYDDCTGDAVVDNPPVVTSSNSNSHCNNVVTVKWVARDTCNNQITFDRVVNVNDVTAPALTRNDKCPLLIQCPSDIDAFKNVFSARDVCSGARPVTFTDLTPVPKCGKWTRRFTAVDTCGNSASKDIVLETGHNILPTITLPSPQTMTCQNHAGCLATPTAVGKCGEKIDVVLENQTYTWEGRCGRKLTRVWSATDFCGNKAFKSEDVAINDVTPPTLNVPSDKTLECTGGNEDVSPVALGYAFATDDCEGNLTPSYIDEAPTVSTKCNRVFRRKWYVQDSCGNAATLYQTITIQDTTSPIMSVGSRDLYYQCPSEDLLIVPTVSDVCQGRGLSSTHIDTIKSASTRPGCGDKVIERVWTSDDGCRNSVSDKVTIYIADTTKPKIIPPCAATIECKLKLDPAYTGTPKGYSDNCNETAFVSKPTYTDVSYPAGVDPPSYVIRTWCIEDNCGNKQCVDQRITLLNDKPNITIPPDTTVDCLSERFPDTTGWASVNDKCNGTSQPTYTDEIIGTCPWVVKRTWYVENKVTGQSQTAIQTITVRNTKRAIINTRGQLQFTCIHDINTTLPSVQLPCDELKPFTIENSDIRITFPPGDFKFLRKWRVTDRCGSITDANQTIDVKDRVPPTVNSASDYDTSCRFRIHPNITGYATGVDNCNVIPLDENFITTIYEDSDSPYNCPSKIIRTWTARDSAGNTNTGTQTINIRPSPPTFDGRPLGSFTVQCPDEIGNLPILLATDSCGYKIKPTLKTSAGGSSCPSQITQTWTATDFCGLSTTFTRVITIEDKTPPIMRLITTEDQQVECEADIQLDNICFAKDNCGGRLTPYYVDDRGDNCTCADTCGRTIKRTWYVKDSCGNPSQGISQRITIRQVSPPTLVVPSNRVINCLGEKSLLPEASGEARAIDVCGKRLPTYYNDTVAFTDDLNFVITRVWYTSDHCGNSASGVQLITVNLKPISFKLPDYTGTPIPCGADNSPELKGGEPEINWGCSGRPTISWYDDPACPAVPGQKKRYWVATVGGRVLGRATQTLNYLDCPSYVGEFKNLPSEPKVIGTQIQPYLVITDQDLPCEKITVTWYWNFGRDQTLKQSIVCDPDKPQKGCTFDLGRNRVIVSADHTFNTAGAWKVRAVITGQRSVNVDASQPVTSGSLIRDSYTILEKDFVTFDPSAGNVMGDLTVIPKPSWVLYLPNQAQGTPQQVPPTGQIKVAFGVQFAVYDLMKVKSHGTLSIIWSAVGLSLYSNNITRMTMYPQADGSNSASAEFEGYAQTSFSSDDLYFKVYVVDGDTTGYSNLGDYFRMLVKTQSNALIFDSASLQDANDFHKVDSSVQLTGAITIANPPPTTISALTSESGTAAGVDVGMVVGIVVGVLLFIVVIAVVIYVVLRQTHGAAAKPQEKFHSMM